MQLISLYTELNDSTRMAKTIKFNRLLPITFNSRIAYLTIKQKRPKALTLSLSITLCESNTAPTDYEYDALALCFQKIITKKAQF